MTAVVAGLLIVTVNDPLEWFPAASVATHDTNVSPTGNMLPDAGVHVTSGEEVTASVAVATNETDLPDGEAASPVRCEGSDNTGAIESFNVTVKDPLAVLPASSCDEHCTVVVPRGNTLPLAGAHVTAGDGVTASVAVATNDTA